MGKVQVTVQFGCYPDFSGFNTAMIGGIIADVIRFLAVLKEQFDIAIESSLIPFNRKMVVCIPFFDQICG